MGRSRNLRINRNIVSQEEEADLNAENQRMGQNSTNETDRNLHQQGGANTNTECQNEGRTYECTTEDGAGKRTRGRTVLADVWNLPEGSRIVVEINKSNQPIGDEGGVLGHFCGTIARNGDICSLSYTRWDYLKKGNKGNNITLIFKEIQKRFLYPKTLEKWILTSIGHKWRDHKCLLKGKYYSDDANITQLHNNCPEDVRPDQWISLVNFWRSDEGQKRSRLSKLSHQKAKTKPIHTSGTKSHARVSEELKQTLQRSPTRTEVYLECHQHKNEAEVTDRIKEIVTQQDHVGLTLNDDPVAQVLGKDQYGRVRGLGLGVKPSDLSQASATPFCNGLNMSSTDETTTIFLIRQLKDEVQALKQIVVEQGNTIINLKRKRSNDRRNSSESQSGESSSEEAHDDNDEEEHFM